MLLLLFLLLLCFAAVCYDTGRMQRLSNERPSTAAAEAAEAAAVAAKALRPAQWSVDESTVVGLLPDDMARRRAELSPLSSLGSSPYATFALSTEAALESALGTSFAKGGHVHQLMASACMELVLLYGNGPVRGLEAQHRDLACFYLRQAATIRARCVD